MILSSGDYSAQTFDQLGADREHQQEVNVFVLSTKCEIYFLLKHFLTCFDDQATVLLLRDKNLINQYTYR